ncbi:TetR family transcriptional regulator [Leptospira hartskeerlii]|uniref:TetR family transcriptional regulator n=1 Tax=Leptospira hartskeerlii TaxID=2023177 RepID=A0A2M9XCY2_9LEPT|nr:TetR/AcrR family transcriptional regulator [Leptospira hartskeerlii]PJZ25422.1 TetR family transcriptional regulator [Leptospira hartskeerlii]PJZ32599.1 TetR family transcriptional regulator [Leptospira hartskeerlii]
MKLETSGSRRQDNKTKNRNAILNAARRVFATIGFEACSTREIIRESGLAQGTFYNYYKDKESVMQDIADELAEGIRKGIREARAKAETPLAFLSDAYFAVFHVMMQDRIHLDLLTRNRDIIRGYLFQGGSMTYILEELDSDLKRMVELGGFPAHPIRITSVMMVAAGFEAMVLLAKEDGYNLRKLSDYLGLLFQGGITNVSRVIQEDRELQGG